MTLEINLILYFVIYYKTTSTRNKIDFMILKFKFLLNLFLSTVENSEKIIVLDQGRIVEEGSHKQLMKKNGYYSKLYNSYYTSLG